MQGKPNRPRRTRWTRLYNDVGRKLYWKVKFVDAKQRITIPIEVTHSLIKRSARGCPLECLIANGLQDFAAQHPDAFPHPVLYAYVIRKAIYLITRIEGVPTHAVRYFHDQAHNIESWDAKERQQLRTLIVHLRPAKKRGGVEPPGARDRRRHGPVGPQLPISTGAFFRAQQAGYYPRRNDRTKANAGEHVEL
jgi:hypothetical protein